MAIDRWDDIRLSVAIQHTPRRDRDAVYLALREALPEAEVVVDPAPEQGVATWRTYEECLTRTPRSATHRLVLQDDVCTCTSFLYGVREAVKQRPDVLLSFFLSKQPSSSAIQQLQAAERGEAWSYLDTNSWVPTQALCWPVFLIGPILRYVRRYPLPISYEGDDSVVGRYCRQTGLRVLQSVPSLVEHVHAETSSLDGLSAPGPARFAALCIGDYHPVDDVDWRTGAW